MNSRMSENLDWSRSKSASSVKQRGNMSLIAATIIKNGELIKLVDLEQERAAGGRSLAEIYISVM